MRVHVQGSHGVCSVTVMRGTHKGRFKMEANGDDARTRLLDPVDRVSEILFGLIMAVTILGSLSIATAGKEEMRTVTAAALGCNLAWGLVDAVMYLVRTGPAAHVTARSRRRYCAPKTTLHTD